MASHSRIGSNPALRLFLGTLLVFTCLRVWSGPIDVLPAAVAQIPDAGRQRLRLVELTGETNRLLREIKDLLKSGSLQVRVEGTDKKPVAPRASDGR